MKRGWLIVLLLSLGMNLGLGLNALRSWLLAPEPEPQRLHDPGLDMPVDHAEIERFLGRRLDRMAARLDLSPQQKAALWDIHLAEGRTIVAQRRELQQAREALQQMLNETETSMANIQAAQHKVSVLQTSLDSVVVRVMFRERAVLTPEQQQAYRGFFPHRHEGQHGKHGYRAGRRGDREGRPETP